MNLERAATLGQRESAAMAPSSDGQAKSGVVPAAREAEQHRGQEVEQRRLPRLVRTGDDGKAGREVVDPEVAEATEAVDMHAADAHRASSGPVAVELAEGERQSAIDECAHRFAR